MPVWGSERVVEKMLTSVILWVFNILSILTLLNIERFSILDDADINWRVRCVSLFFLFFQQWESRPSPLGSLCSYPIHFNTSCPFCSVSNLLFSSLWLVSLFSFLSWLNILFVWSCLGCEWLLVISFKSVEAFPQMSDETLSSCNPRTVNCCYLVYKSCTFTAYRVHSISYCKVFQ